MSPATRGLGLRFTARGDGEPCRTIVDGACAGDRSDRAAWRPRAGGAGYGIGWASDHARRGVKGAGILKRRGDAKGWAPPRERCRGRARIIAPEAFVALIRTRAGLTLRGNDGSAPTGAPWLWANRITARNTGGARRTARPRPVSIGVNERDSRPSLNTRSGSLPTAPWPADTVACRRARRDFVTTPQCAPERLRAPRGPPLGNLGPRPAGTCTANVLVAPSPHRDIWGRPCARTAQRAFDRRSVRALAGAVPAGRSTFPRRCDCPLGRSSPPSGRLLSGASLSADPWGNLRSGRCQGRRRSSTWT